MLVLLHWKLDQSLLLVGCHIPFGSQYCMDTVLLLSTLAIFGYSRLSNQDIIKKNRFFSFEYWRGLERGRAQYYYMIIPISARTLLIFWWSKKERKSRLFRLSGTHKKMSEKGVLGCQKNALGWSQCQKNALLAKALMLLNSAFFLLDTLNLRRPCQNEEKI